MKIAVNTLGPSKIKAGIGNYVAQVCALFPVLAAKHSYVYVVNKENETLFNQIPNIQLLHAPSYTKNRLLRMFYEQFILPLQLKREKIDILFSPGFVCPIIKTAKYVTTIHDMTFFTHPQYHESWKVRYFKRMIPISVRRSDAILADSESTRQDILKILKTKEEKVTTIPLAANKIPFWPLNSSKELLKKKYGIKDHFILFVGMIEPRKNVESLIKAFAQIKSKEKLVIVGKQGWMMDHLQTLIAELNLKERIIFTGYVPDEELGAFYAKASVFVYPSHYEGFGLPVLEAMQAGCPVITSNISSLPEVAGEAAILVDPNDVKSIANAINTVLADKLLQSELMDKGKVQAEKFSWEKTAKETLKVFEQVMK